MSFFRTSGRNRPSSRPTLAPGAGSPDGSLDATSPEAPLDDLGSAPPAPPPSSEAPVGQDPGELTRALLHIAVLAERPDPEELRAILTVAQTYGLDPEQEYLDAQDMRDPSLAPLPTYDRVAPSSPTAPSTDVGLEGLAVGTDVTSPPSSPATSSPAGSLLGSSEPPEPLGEPAPLEELPEAPVGPAPRDALRRAVREGNRGRRTRPGGSIAP
jgi:hypothetical protein